MMEKNLEKIYFPGSTAIKKHGSVRKKELARRLALMTPEGLRQMLLDLYDAESEEGPG